MMATKTKICVIGQPVAHSRSPLIHNYWIKEYGLSAEYVRVEKSPQEFPDFLQKLSAHGYSGANITIPHKQAAFELADQTDELAKRLQAVNIIYIRDGRLCGANSDGIGFIASLKAQTPQWQSKKSSVLVLGAGGAARAIIGALSDLGLAQIYVANRTLEKAQNLARDLGKNIKVLSWLEIQSHLPKIDLLVNATSLGMENMPPLELDISNLSPATIIADIVYAPLETQLLKAARANGHETIDGLGMLLHQAARGFELWFNIKPEVTSKLRILVAKDLGY